MISIGLDIGTTTVSAVAVNTASGNVLKAVTVENGSFLHGSNGFERLQDADKIFSKVQSVLKELCDFDEVLSIGITGQMHGIVYLDKDGNAVSPLYTWQDGRGNEPYEKGETYAEALSRITGYPLATGYGAVTHFYNLKNGLVPENAVKLCTVHDYIGAKLAGIAQPITHISDAASLGVFDIEKGRFDFESLEKADIKTDIFPKVTDDFEIIGAYEKIPVSVAIGDNQASFIGSVTGEDCLLANVGTGSQVSVITDKTSAPDGIEVRPLFKGVNLLVGSSLCGGRAYAILEEFFKKTLEAFGTESKEPLYSVMDRLALTADNAESLKVSTLFSGTRAEPNKRGSIENIGIYNFTPEAFVKGTLEGMTDELYGFYKDMEDLTLCKPKIMVGSGNGIRKNQPLKNIIKNRFGLDLVMPEQNEEAAFGAMLFSLVSMGKFNDIYEAQKSFVKVGEKQ